MRKVVGDCRFCDLETAFGRLAVGYWNVMIMIWSVGDMKTFCFYPLDSDNVYLVSEKILCHLRRTLMWTLSAHRVSCFIRHVKVNRKTKTIFLFSTEFNFQMTACDLTAYDLGTWTAKRCKQPRIWPLTDQESMVRKKILSLKRIVTSCSKATLRRDVKTWSPISHGIYEKFRQSIEPS